ATSFVQVKRSDIFVTAIVGEDKASSRGGQGIAAAVRSTLASGRVDASDSDSGGGGDGGGRLLDFADALVLARGESGGFDEDGSFLKLWHEARVAAASSTSSSSPDQPLARHVGIGGDGPVEEHHRRKKYQDQKQEQERDQEQGQEQEQEQDDVDGGGVRGEQAEVWAGVSGPAAAAAAAAVPSLFFGDLRAGDGATTAATMEMCRDAGVQAFSWRYDGGQGGEEAGKGAAAAADYEHEDVTGDEVLAKWIMEIGGGVVWRPREVDDVARTLPLARYFLHPEWITEIVDRGGCPPEAWAQTLSRLLPPEGTPSEEDLEAEVDATIEMLMASAD
ncbi:unnamed protein product, partial [Laminaria digitata]